MKKLLSFLGASAVAAALIVGFAEFAPDAHAQGSPAASLVCNGIGQGQLKCSWASPWQPLQKGDATVIGPSPFLDPFFGQKVAWETDIHLTTPNGSDMGSIRRFYGGHINEAGAFVNDNGATSDTTTSVWSYIGVGLDGSTVTSTWQNTWPTLSDGGDAGEGPSGPAVTVTCNTTACSAATVFTIQYYRLVGDSGT